MDNLNFRDSAGNGRRIKVLSYDHRPEVEFLPLADDNPSENADISNEKGIITPSP
jgi:hypothetical protein